MAETTARVRLDPMTEPEFGSFRESGIRGYAQDKIDSGEWAPEEALDLSRADYRRLLPNGLQSPDQHLFTVRDAESGEPAATLWLALRLRGGSAEAYVYDIEVREPFRGRGYGRATMLAGIEKARELGAQTMGLHVFGHNKIAQALYRSLGFAETNISMSLKL
jgi:ribosomal protein S18 acetylase RimI-like enzyme